MRQVAPPIRIVQKILGEQKMTEGGLYRLTTYSLRVEQPEGVLLYHTLTGELLLLSREEAEQLGELPGPIPQVLRTLIPRWFLRPENSDDMALADQVRQIVERFGKKETAATKYKIFTTTACNARCFYCYETGWKKTTMSEQTARDTAKYIGAHRAGRPVRLEWFGGEPLMNTRAIDLITACLRRQGVGFRSTMISNGYLFDEALVQRARDDWGLMKVTITLDGTEEVYNRRKAYVHPAGSPFQRVLENIGLLLDAGIAVNVRLNVDGENERDLYALIDQLTARFGKRPGFGVSVSAIWENAGIDPHSYTEEQRRVYAQKLRSLRAWVERNAIAARTPLKGRFVADSCLADSGSAAIVTPEGLLSRCVVCKDGAIWGSVYSDETNEQTLRQWQERKPPEAACQACLAYPRCVRLKKCPIWPEHCSPIERAYREDTLCRAVLGAYEDWKAAGQI